MKVISASTEILNPENLQNANKFCEKIGRVCYKSEDLITDESADKFIKGIIKSGHETIIEHISVSVRFICDRGISHELVRHRVASFSQESTRYCNYSKDKHENQITLIEPCFWGRQTPHWYEWIDTMEKVEESYLRMIAHGAQPQQARAILPNSLKTEIIMTCNLREWRHFFKLRALGITGKPHPQMLELTIPLLKKFAELNKTIFGDLADALEGGK
jgi:thymidylate synthase (FAD)